MAIVFKVKPWYKQKVAKIVPFSTGTDAEIAAMLKSYYNNELTWQEMGWRVGDTRLIHLDAMQAPTPSSGTVAAQDITIMIVARNRTKLATPINGHTNACITVQTRECISGVNIYVNGDSSYDKTFNKWSNLYLRTYLNNTVFGAIPTGAFKSAIKQSSNYRHTTYDGNTAEQVTDTLFLPSYPEVFGSQSVYGYAPTSPTEGSIFPYYSSSSSNAIKYVNNNGSASSSKSAWWLGSPCNLYTSSSFGYRWIMVTEAGEFSRNIGYGTDSSGLAPAWAM